MVLKTRWKFSRSATGPWESKSRIDPTSTPLANSLGEHLRRNGTSVPSATGRGGTPAPVRFRGPSGKRAPRPAPRKSAVPTGHSRADHRLQTDSAPCQYLRPCDDRQGTQRPLHGTRGNPCLSPWGHASPSPRQGVTVSRKPGHPRMAGAPLAARMRLVHFREPQSDPGIRHPAEPSD